MHENFGIAADADFFDWVSNVDPRFFIAPELGVMNGYALQPPRAALPSPEKRISLPYNSELPRSAS